MPSRACMAMLATSILNRHASQRHQPRQPGVTAKGALSCDTWLMARHSKSRAQHMPSSKTLARS